MWTWLCQKALGRNMILVRFEARERASAVDAPRHLPFIDKFLDLLHRSLSRGLASRHAARLPRADFVLNGAFRSAAIGIGDRDNANARAYKTSDGLFRIRWLHGARLSSLENRPIVVDSGRNLAESKSRKFPLKSKVGKFDGLTVGFGASAENFCA
jgi:hypothetical protein